MERYDFISDRDRNVYDDVAIEEAIQEAELGSWAGFNIAGISAFAVLILAQDPSFPTPNAYLLKGIDNTFYPSSWPRP